MRGMEGGEGERVSRGQEDTEENVAELQVKHSLA